MFQISFHINDFQTLKQLRKKLYSTRIYRCVYELHKRKKEGISSRAVVLFSLRMLVDKNAVNDNVCIRIGTDKLNKASFKGSKYRVTPPTYFLGVMIPTASMHLPPCLFCFLVDVLTFSPPIPLSFTLCDTGLTHHF